MVPLWLISTNLYSKLATSTSTQHHDYEGNDGVAIMLLLFYIILGRTRKMIVTMLVTAKCLYC